MAAHLFVIVKHTVAPEGTRADNMAICHNVPIFGVYDKTCSLAGGGQVGIKRAGLAEMYRDHTLDHLFDCGLPLRRVSCSRDSVDCGNGIRVGFNVVHGAILRSGIPGGRDSVLLLELLFRSSAADMGLFLRLGRASPMAADMVVVVDSGRD